MIDKSAMFAKYEIKLTSTQLELFEKYLVLFMDYNSHTNLSSIRDEQGIIEKHFIDSVMPYKLIPNFSGKILDIGSGGGFPGIPLLIMNQNLHLTLLDSVGKKCRAIQHFINRMELKNAVVINQRAEEYAAVKGKKRIYDFVICRSLAYMPQALKWCEPFITNEGRVILYKTASELELRDGINSLEILDLAIDQTIDYQLAGMERKLIILKKRG